MDSDNDDPHGAIDTGRPANPPGLEDQVANQEPGKYIAVQATDGSGNALSGTSFVQANMVLTAFTSGVTQIQFVANQLDLNGNSVPDNSFFKLWTGQTVADEGDQIKLGTSTLSNRLRIRPRSIAAPGTLYLNSTTGTFTFYVQALKAGIANIQLQIDPTLDNCGSGSDCCCCCCASADWVTVDSAMFTALDTNVGSPNGVNVTPAGYLTIINDPLGVGSGVYMNSAHRRTPSLTPSPTNATIGLPAHLVLTGNGVAVLDNDQIDIWDWDNIGTSSPNWVLVPRKPQAQGTMVQDGNTYVQTLPNGTVRTFAAPNPDGQSTTSPDDFGLLQTSETVYGSATTTSYKYQYSSSLPGGVMLSSEITPVSLSSSETIKYTTDTDNNLEETVTVGPSNTPVSRAAFIESNGKLGLIETYNADGNLSGVTYYGYAGNMVSYVLTTNSIARILAANDESLATYVGSEMTPPEALAGELLTTLNGYLTTAQAGTITNFSKYADNAVTYLPTSSTITDTTFYLQRGLVATNTVQGSGKDQYAYTLAQDPTTGPNFPDGLNTWSVKETETLADNTSRITTFSNFDGDPMITDTSDGTNHWIRWNRYDQYSNVLLAAQPSAVTGYSTSQTDLIGFKASSTNITDGTSSYVNPTPV